jgi:uncharacterized protein YuzE
LVWLPNQFGEKESYGRSSRHFRLRFFLPETRSKKLWGDYDEEADVLYVGFRRPQKVTDSRMEGDLIYHYRDEELVGMTILHVSEVTNTQKK